jgi:Fanconi-associated nuclease 1
VRLFLRKTSAWHRISRLGYHEDIADLSTAVKCLQNRRSLPKSSAKVTVNPWECVHPESLSLVGIFTFADASEVDISTLDEASSLLNLDELKIVAKEAKVQGKTKGDLLEALRRMSNQQSSLRWSGLKRYDSKQSSGIGASDNEEENKPEQTTVLPHRDGETTGCECSVNQENRNGYFIRKILTSVGPCIRLSIQTLMLFERVHLVFYRSTEWTEKSLTTIILARISRRNFPQYIISRSTNIFASRSVLLEFEAALRTQFRMDGILEFNGPPGQKGFDEVLTILDEVYPRWKLLLESEQRKEDHIYEIGEGAYLRRFSPAWVYTRIVHKACYVLGRCKMHEREWQILTELLDQRLFHAARRGAWYQRRALLEEHYMAAIKPLLSVGDLHQQKQYWRRVSLKTCEHGLQDKDCHVIYHYDLQKRVQKLEKILKLAKREQHDFGHVLLRQPKEINVTGIRVQKETSMLKRANKSEDLRKNTKTIWIDEREGGGECSVESMCLSWYREQGWRGYHAEGGIMRTLFAYLFYDVLFTYVPNVFQTPYQTCPLDLHTDAFYPSRASEINHRLVEIANGNAERLIREVDGRERQNKTCVIGLSWDFELDDLLQIVSCFDSTALATICKVMAQEYRQRGGGMPDLFLWNPERKQVKFSEVKSENDRLSDTQRLWIHVLTGAGIEVELCNAIAREVRIKME